MDSIQKRSSGISLFLAALALVAAGVTSSAKIAAAATPATATITARHAHDVQLADEITRRLRRIGISFVRTRLPHPYDPAGEVC
ncbi:MAG: hypothetical protein ACTHN5_06745 [Phycisphaerae bacterium]